MARPTKWCVDCNDSLDGEGICQMCAIIRESKAIADLEAERDGLRERCANYDRLLGKYIETFTEEGAVRMAEAVESARAAFLSGALDEAESHRA